MKVNELNRDQIIELKQRYYTEKHNKASYEELINIDNLVSDNEIYSTYDYVEFTPEDFFSNSSYENNKEEEVL